VEASKSSLQQQEQHLLRCNYQAQTLQLQRRQEEEEGQRAVEQQGSLRPRSAACTSWRSAESGWATN
jgi:hypothetical protein